MATSSSIWVFYFIQGEPGEDRSHPNAYSLTLPSNGDLCFKHVLDSFPLPAVEQFHFRFRLDYPKGGTFYWLDINKREQKVPVMNDRLVCKLLCLHRKPKMGIILRRKRISFQSTTNEEKKELPEAFHRSSSSPPSADVRPAPYTDKQHQRNSSLSPRRRPKPESPKKKQQQQQQQPVRQKRDSFSDFISSSPKKDDATDFMSNGWDDPQSRAKKPSDFMSTMDPLSKSPPPPAVKSPENKFQEGGQTVGPVTLAEMEQVRSKSTADGTGVYNAKFVDKSTKSAHVRKAMEKREKEANDMADRARTELREREKAQKDMEVGKQQAKAEIGLKLKMWAEDNGRKKNIRTLLSTMHQVMWENSKWKEVSMAKLLNPLEVKKSHRRAMLVVHPDKNSGRTPTQVFIAERIFDAVNGAWEEFAAKEMPQ